MAELSKRSHLSRGGRIYAGVILAVMGTASMFVTIEPNWVSWAFLTISVVGVCILGFWKAEEKEELNEEDLIEITKNAIRAEAERLDLKRAKLEDVLMSYGEWMEYPNFEELERTQWATQEKTAQDQQVQELLATESDRMLARFSGGDYWEDKKFQMRPMLLDLYNFVENVAKIYRPDSERPLLETNLELMLKAVNRASLQVILLLEEFPVIDVKELNLRKMSDKIRQAGKMYKKYEELSPYLSPVRYLWQGSKLLLASNPLLAAGWIAGSELFWKGGKKLGRKALDAYLLSLMRQAMGIVAWETAGIFDRSHRYRDPDWVYAVELTHLVSIVGFTNETVRAAMRELSILPLKSSYDRIFLYRCVAQHVSPKPERFAQPDLLTEETRVQILVKLKEFLSKEVQQVTSKEINEWQVGLEKRLVIDE